MCLTIDRNHHKWFKGSIPRPKRTWKNITCTKILTKVLRDFWYADDEDNFWVYRTPCQGYDVTFDKDGVAELSAQMRVKRNDNIYYHNSYAFEVHEGIHSFDSRTYPHFPANAHHYAVIPRGTKYYIGCEDDLVSEKLIIFRTEESYRNWKKKHSIFGFVKKRSEETE